MSGSERARDGDFTCRLTDHGFGWGPVEVTRAAFDPRDGVWLLLKTPREEVEVRVTPAGLIRLGKPQRKRK